MQETKKVFASAVISELQSSDMYLTLKARLFDLKANLNGVRVTEAFLDEIIKNEDKYVCIPLYADIRGLLANRTVGHMYNARTGEFYSTQIGSFYHYEKEIDGDDVYLVGYARVMKRNKALCKALTDLFADNALKFSFEINCAVYEELDNGEMLIDVNEKNYFEGECVVTFPACEKAEALELVAECLGKGDENMADEKIEIAETEEVEVAEAIGEGAENENAADAPVVAETEVAEIETAATVVVTQQHTEIDNTYAYNCDTGESVEERICVDTVVRTPIEVAETQTDDENKEPDKNNEDVIAEETPGEDTEDKNDEDDDMQENAACSKKEKETAEVDFSKELAEIKNAIEALRTIVAEVVSMNASRQETAIESGKVESNEVIAESENSMNETVVAEVEAPVILNPFMASITAPSKYSLLECKEKKPTNKYRLLECS